MDDLDQKKLDVIKQVLKDCYPQSIIYPKFTNDAKKILSALKQFDTEPLEVEFMEGCFFKRQGTFEETSRAYEWAVGILNRKDDGYGILFWCDTKQEALAWCEKKGLRWKK